MKWGITVFIIVVLALLLEGLFHQTHRSPSLVGDNPVLTGPSFFSQSPKATSKVSSTKDVALPADTMIMTAGSVASVLPKVKKEHSARAPQSVPISPYLSITFKPIRPKETFIKQHPGSESTPFFDVTLHSIYPDEQEVPFTQLTGNCEALKNFQYPVALRINGNGGVIEAVPLLPGTAATDSSLRNELRFYWGRFGPLYHDEPPYITV